MKTRSRHRTLVLATLLAGMALATSGPQAAAQILDVRPILDCIEYTPGSKELTAWWGYDNRAQSTFINPGADNFFDGPTPFLGQPNLFLSGEHHHVFSVPFDPGATPSLTWTVLEHSATASNDPHLYCNYIPRTMMWAGDWASDIGYRRGDVVRHGGSTWVAKQDSSGVPPAEGETWALLATKGDTGQAGPQGPQGPPGPAGALVASLTHTFPASGKLTISDPSVTATSVIVVQYVGGGVLRRITVRDGGFTAIGRPRKQFRYVVFP
jgi:hypothetical protein